MFIREEAEAREELYLSKFASKSKETKGRVRSEVSCSIRTEYHRYRYRIFIVRLLEGLSTKLRFSLHRRRIITEQGLRIPLRWHR